MAAEDKHKDDTFAKKGADEDLEDDVEIEDDDDLDGLEHDEESDDDAEAAEDDAEEESDDDASAAEDEEESLDVLLARDQGEDEDLLRLDDEPRDGLSIPVDPIGAGEFTCRSCFLVKRRAQLADERKLICFDCV